MTAKLTNRLSLPCPYCGSATGDVCRNAKGQGIKPHLSRLRPDVSARGPGRPKGVYYTKTLAGPAELASELMLGQCPKCGAKPYKPCRNGSGHATNPHDARPYHDESDPPETPMTTNPNCRRCGSEAPPLFHWHTDTMDAGLLCKNCTTQAVLRCYGIATVQPCPDRRVGEPL